MDCNLFVTGVSEAAGSPIRFVALNTWDTNYFVSQLWSHYMNLTIITHIKFLKSTRIILVKPRKLTELPWHSSLS